MFVAFKHALEKPDLANTLISFWTDSDWVHCEVLLEYPRRLAISSRTENGVTAMLWEDVLTNPDQWEMYQVPIMNRDGIWSFLAGETGKKFNWTGLVAGHVVGITQLQPDGWFCSELTYSSLLQYAQIDLPLREPAHVSPALLRQYLIDAKCTRYIFDNHQLVVV